MPKFTQLDKELQMKVRQMEHYANELGKESPECRKLWRELAKSEIGCFALMKKDGEYSACLRKPTDNSLKIHKNPRCGTHGGLAPAHEDIPEESKLKRLKNLRPDAHMIHGLYASESTFVKSLTEDEIKFMAWLEAKVRENYEVEEGLGDVVLEGMIVDAVMHFRLINSGRFDKGSKHTAKPLMDLMKQAKDMGWTKKEKDSQSNSKSVLDKWLNKLDNIPATPKDDEEDSKELPH